MDVTEKILEMIAKWEPFGQGVFFVFLVLVALSVVLMVARYAVVLFRGWPPIESDAESNPVPR